MKKIIILIVLLQILFISCKRCAECTVKTTSSITPNITGYPQTTYSTLELCGDDLKELDGKTTVSKSNAGTHTITVTQTVNCN